MDVGVRGALDEATGGRRELVALEEVARRLDQGDQRQQHRDVDLHQRVDPLSRSLEADPAVQVVGDDGDDEDHRQSQEGPAHEEGEERQLEDVEADVHVELRILYPERHGVAEEDPVVPLPRRPDSDQ